MKDKNQSAVLHKVNILTLLAALLLSVAAPAVAQAGAVVTEEELPVLPTIMKPPTSGQPIILSFTASPASIARARRACCRGALAARRA